MLQLDIAVSHEDPGPAVTTADQNAKFSTGMPCQARGCFTFFGSASSSNVGVSRVAGGCTFYFPALQIGLCCCRVAFLSKVSCWSLISPTPPHCIIKPQRSMWKSVSLSWGSYLTEASSVTVFWFRVLYTPIEHLFKSLICVFVKNHLAICRLLRESTVKRHHIIYSEEQN